MADDAPSTALAVRSPHYAAVGMNAFGSGALPALSNLADVVSIAQLMAKAGIAVRAHLRENPGACLAVTMQALRWNADPFAIANKTFSVNDQLAYESQVIAAVINTLAPIKGRPEYAYDGDGGQRRVTVSVTTTEGQVLTLTTPVMDKIHPKNSPLWKSDPDQQLGYYAVRALGRRYFPEVILGIYDPDEMERREEPHRQRLTSGFGDDATALDHARLTTAPTPATAQVAEARDDVPQNPEPSAATTPTPADAEPSPPNPEHAPVQKVAAPADEVYVMAGEAVGDDGKRQTYKNGVAFSRASEKASAKLKAYDLHAPKMEAETILLAAATSSPAEDAASPASDDGAATDAGTDGTGEPTTAEESGDDAPPYEDAEIEDINPMVAAMSALDEAGSLQAIKAVINATVPTQAFKDAGPEGQKVLRQRAWDRYEALHSKGIEDGKVTTDLTAMSLYLEFGARTKTQLDTMWATFFQTDLYRNCAEGWKKGFAKIMAERKAVLP